MIQLVPNFLYQSTHRRLTDSWIRNIQEAFALIIRKEQKILLTIHFFIFNSLFLRHSILQYFIAQFHKKLLFFLNKSLLANFFYHIKSVFQILIKYFFNYFLYVLLNLLFVTKKFGYCFLSLFILDFNCVLVDTLLVKSFESFLDFLFCLLLFIQVFSYYVGFMSPFTDIKAFRI